MPWLADRLMRGKVFVCFAGRRTELVGVTDSMGSVDDDYRPAVQYAPGSQKRG